jgi:hypothetical protein
VHEPAGAGYAKLKVDNGGRLTMSGYLADRSVVAENTSLTKDGRWPLFVGLYRGSGVIYGWMSFENQSDSDVHGSLVWTRPVSSTIPIPGTNLLEVVGSRYQLPTGTTTALGFTNGLAIFSQGEAFTPFTNRIILGPNNKVTNAGTNRLTLTLAPTTGLFQGTVTHLALGKSTAFKGALLQEQQAGYGFFTTTNHHSGLISILPDR